LEGKPFARAIKNFFKIVEHEQSQSQKVFLGEATTGKSSFQSKRDKSGSILPRSIR
jgi:hypothetical protein